MITLLLAFTACSVDYDIPMESSFIVDHTIQMEEEQPDAELTPMAEAEAVSALAIYTEDGAAGFVEVRPWGFAPNGGMTMGEPLAVSKVAGPIVQVDLPTLLPSPVSDASAVAYAIALRDEDRGAPGVYTGLSEMDLVYVRDPAAFPGAKAGWNLAFDFASGEPVWADVADGVDLGPSLQGAMQLNIAGSMGVDAPAGTHITLVSQTNDGIRQAFDSPIGEEWSIFLEGGPRAEVLVRSEMYEGARFNLYAYQDDGDNRWNGEAVAAHACAGGSDAVVTWYAAPFDLGRALTLRAMGVRAGWDVLLYSADGEDRLPMDQYDALVLNDTCG
jgi:hypothetical protein